MCRRETPPPSPHPCPLLSCLSRLLEREGQGLGPFPANLGPWPDPPCTGPLNNGAVSALLGTGRPARPPAGPGRGVRREASGESSAPGPARGCWARGTSTLGSPASTPGSWSAPPSLLSLSLPSLAPSPRDILAVSLPRSLPQPGSGCRLPHRGLLPSPSL